MAAPGRGTRNSDTPESELTDPVELETYQEIERLRAETGPGSCRKIVVFKRRPDGSKWDRCKQFASSELDIDQLPIMFGGGDFTLELLSEANRYLRRFPISFSTAVYPESPAASAPPAAGAHIDPMAGSLPAFMQEMRSETKAAQDRHMQFMETVITAIIGGQRPTSTKELVENLAALKGLTDSNPPKPDTSLISDAIKTGMELAGRARGDSSDDDDEGNPTMRIVERCLDKLLSQPHRQPQRAPVGTTAGRAAPGQPQQAGNLPPELQQYAWLGKFAPYLIGWARQQFSPERAARVILEFVTTDEHLALLEQFVRMPPNERNPILTMLDGRLGNYQQFINDLAAALTSEFETGFEADAEVIDGDDGTAEDPAQSA